jgi:CheY-like chemotaxis protein/two-component sensor histidine kinase
MIFWPLRTISVLLRARTANDESMAALSNVVERQVGQMSRLLDDLLDVSRITLNRLELRLEPTDIAEVLDAAVEQTRAALETAQQTLVIDIPHDPPAVVLADRARLTQAFANILQNAAKYSAGPGQVRIGVRLEQQQLHVDVKDSGIGIVPDALASIFSLFVQAPTPVRPQVAGLGIGLALVRGVVELHGGSVVACSDGPGTGSTFTVTLPLSDATLLSRPAPTSPPLASYLGNRRLDVLVVDDNRDAADSLADVLRMLGHTVEVSYNGKESLARVAAKQPDVVILDIGLPDMSGYDLARQLRTTSAGRNMLLIAITGWAGEEHRAAAKAAGFDRHFTKPVEFEPLLELLSAYARGKGPE